jgi:hypothetical protein
MKAQIYVNRHIMTANKKATKETGEIVDRPAIAVNTYKGSVYCKEVEFIQGCKLIQNAEQARCSGATIWIEVDDSETLIIDGKEMLKNQELAEMAIREARETVDYNTTEYPLEHFIDKITQKQIDELLHWDKAQQSYFVESLLLGLPVLNIVINDNDDKFKIIDGKQRLYTAINFIQGNLELQNLKTLSSLNSFGFKDLTLPRQRKFKRISVRAIAIAPNFDISVWNVR